MRRLCKATKKDGTPCNAPAQTGSDYCFTHDPEKAEEAKEARLAGSEAARLKRLQDEQAKDSKPIGLFKVNYRLNNLKDIKRFMSDAANAYVQGRITADQSKTIAYLSKILLECIKDGDVEVALKELEDRIASAAHSMQR